MIHNPLSNITPDIAFDTKLTFRLDSHGRTAQEVIDDGEARAITLGGATRSCWITQWNRCVTEPFKRIHRAPVVMRFFTSPGTGLIVHRREVLITLAIDHIGAAAHRCAALRFNASHCSQACMAVPPWVITLGYRSSSEQFFAGLLTGRLVDSDQGACHAKPGINSCNQCPAIVATIIDALGRTTSARGGNENHPPDAMYIPQEDAAIEKSTCSRSAQSPPALTRCLPHERIKRIVSNTAV